MGLNEEQIKKYLEHGGDKCPYCGSDQISADSAPEVDGSSAWQTVACLDCGRCWDDVYKLVSIDEREVDLWEGEDIPPQKLKGEKA